jgi:hypothetical protein
MPVTLELQFNPRKLSGLIKRHHENNGDERDVRLAGERIRSGTGNRADFEAIVKWKTNDRGKSRPSKNTDQEIEDALRLAIAAKTERAAIAVLLGLQGVHVPVASAILTMINPQKYTVIDYRALEALGTDSKDRTINFYLEYLNACRQLAKTHGVSLRDLDRALWQWSKERSAP